MRWHLPRIWPLSTTRVLKYGVPSMSKKRVHEIAKELKGHGIDLDNKEVVTELLSFGYDVKSHSSSLEDDQANEAVRKIVDKRKPKAAPAPVAPKGFMVRRKMGPDTSIPATIAPPAAPAVESVPAANQPPASDFAPPVAAPSAPHAAPVSDAAPVAAESAPLPMAAMAAEAVPAARASAPRIAAARASAPRAAAAMATAAGAAVTTPPPPSAVPPMVRHSVTMGPRASAPRPGGTVVTTRPPVVQNQRPTATQAVVISRPLIQVKRVTPSSTAHKSFPMAPGRKAIGEVKEFKVVSDHLGRGRELVDVSKNKEKERQKGRGRTPEKEGTPSQADMRELVFGRIAIPLRGKKKKPTKKGQKTMITTMAEDKKVIKIQDGITVSELSQRMGIKSNDIIKKLMAGGKMATANQTIDPDTAAILAADYGWKVEKVGFEVEDYLPETEDKAEEMMPRPPVVTVMGHVDHGKTSLLDAIRMAKVAEGETGGITQHVGAYTVKSAKGEITFLDTPGHEAFSAMRARGANVTDIVVLVVAADDGVMPQTKEAIAHAKAAGVPIVVAINKMDVPGANADRVKKDLADAQLLSEDWGGDVIMVPVSAKTRLGLDLLLENISLQAEVLELKANPTRPAVGAIIEARLEKGRGPVATVLVQEGTLKKGDALVTGTFYGRVRMLVNDRGEQIEEVKPGYSAEVIGLSGVPTAGDTINATPDENAAKEIASHRLLKTRQAESGKTSKDSLEALLGRLKQGEAKELKIVLKADVSGSLEAVAQAIEKLTTPKVKATIVHKGVGMMTETDMNTASALKAVVLGFNSRPESGAEHAAKVGEVKYQTFGIIYELLDGVKVMMEDLLEPIRTERKLGRAEVRNLFNVPKLGTIAGSMVSEGTIKRASHMRLWRENKQIFNGKIASLRRFK
ncbi:MAG: infB, partial [Myxococcaceae bacterium]|nr:infB [Myxococcaceae bacterium]